MLSSSSEVSEGKDKGFNTSEYFLSQEFSIVGLVKPYFTRQAFLLMPLL